MIHYVAAFLFKLPTIVSVVRLCQCFTVRKKSMLLNYIIHAQRYVGHIKPFIIYQPKHSRSQHIDLADGENCETSFFLIFVKMLID